ncbi:paralemmin-3 [Mastacembelus armatus]|uniref:Paralemmin 3 n=1 Tax=Mastacembelus armatus TaxID=205130 RepID=A0A3Q3L1G8_9TELE|nr:paralemmin-3-like [Mastacembelus armatus]XP_026159132.1 paralemmin-3-like [Mastacembelus armatus]XP_026159133.1 paralemmin-3-like [Mastacembelus armatus]
MDEAEKYKQRLEAIAEKRRLQEEQDRARRDLEDEKLRLQQLKRKSLRDQWLMEGAPLSPASLDTQSPPSPLWGSQAQEIQHTLKLPSESQQLAEEKDKLKEQMEDGQTETVKLAEAREVVAQDDVQNGENNTIGLETTKDQEKTNHSPLPDEIEVFIINGGRDLDAKTNNSVSFESTQSITNGPLSVTEVVVSIKSESELSQGVSEADPGQVTNVNVNEEEEDVTLVMRAECVIITDEGDDVPEDITLQEDQQETIQSEESPLPNPEATREGGETEEIVQKTETALETFTQKKSEETEPTAEPQPVTGEVEGDINTNKNRDADKKYDEQDKLFEDFTSMELQSPDTSSVPVYSEAQASTHPEAQSEAVVSPEEAEGAIKAHDPATTPDQFQEVPLADPQEDQSTEAGLREQEPLLLQAKAPITEAELATANSPASTEKHSPVRSIQEKQSDAPKHKTCQCCSVM